MAEQNAESVFERDVALYLEFLRRGDRIRFQTDNLTYAEMVRAAAHRRLNAEHSDGSNGGPVTRAQVDEATRSVQRYDGTGP